MRHAILSIIYGPHAPQRVVLAPGQVLRVGSGEKADLQLAKDDSLETIQFELDWDGERCELRHRARSVPTLLDGRPAAQAWAKDGAWIASGESSFIIHYELEPTHADPRPGSESALRLLRAESSLFAVVDAARDRRVRTLLQHAIDPHACLFDGVTATQMADASAYLVEFVPNSRLLASLVEEGWGQAWATYFTTTQSFKKLRRHLRHLLFVDQEGSNERLYFRYYDPRVLRDFIPISPEWQQRELFGAIDAVILEGANGAALRLHRPAASEAAEERAAVFVIGKNQLKWFGEKALGDFHRVMVRYLREAHAHLVSHLGEEELREWVIAATNKAIHSGLATDLEARQLILLFLVLGVEAGSTLSWVDETLSHPRLTAIDKLQQLFYRARDRQIERLDGIVLTDVVGDV